MPQRQKAARASSQNSKNSEGRVVKRQRTTEDGKLSAEDKEVSLM